MRRTILSATSHTPPGHCEAERRTTVKVAEKRIALYEEIVGTIKEARRWTVDQVSGKEGVVPGENAATYEILRKAVTSEEALGALEQVIKDSLELFIQSLMYVFDAGGNLPFRIALVDWDTKENLAPRDEEYHNELAGYLMHGKERV